MTYDTDNLYIRKSQDEKLSNMKGNPEFAFCNSQ